MQDTIEQNNFYAVRFTKYAFNVTDSRIKIAHELAVRTAEQLRYKKLKTQKLKVVTLPFDSLLGRKDSIVVVITPLTAIMKDQVFYLTLYLIGIL